MKKGMEQAAECVCSFRCVTHLYALFAMEQANLSR